MIDDGVSTRMYKVSKNTLTLSPDLQKEWDLSILRDTQMRCWAAKYLGKGEAKGMVQVYTPGRHIPFLKKHGGNVVEVVGAFHWYQICLSLSTFYFL